MKFGEDDNGNITIKKIANALITIYELKNKNRKSTWALIYEEIWKKFKNLTNGIYDNFLTKHDPRQNIYDFKIKMTQ